MLLISAFNCYAGCGVKWEKPLRKGFRSSLKLHYENAPCAKAWRFKFEIKQTQDFKYFVAANEFLGRQHKLLSAKV